MANPPDTGAAGTPGASLADCGTGGARAGFRIDADGTWFHGAAPLGRPALVRHLADCLTRDGRGRYWLVAPGEKIAVTVADAPFVAVEMAVAETPGGGVSLRFRTNVDRWVTLDADHPLMIDGTADAPRPYVVLDGGLRARIARPVYYELAALAVAGPDGRHGVASAGSFFALEPEPEMETKPENGEAGR